MSKSPVKSNDSQETALQLIKECLDEEINAVAHVFVVFGASVCITIVTEISQLIKATVPVGLYVQCLGGSYSVRSHGKCQA